MRGLGNAFRVHVPGQDGLFGVAAVRRKPGPSPTLGGTACGHSALAGAPATRPSRRLGALNHSKGPRNHRRGRLVQVGELGIPVGMGGPLLLLSRCLK